MHKIVEMASIEYRLETQEPSKTLAQEIMTSHSKDAVAKAFIRIWLLRVVKLSKQPVVLSDLTLKDLLIEYLPELDIHDQDSICWHKGLHFLLSQACLYKASLTIEQNIILANIHWLRVNTNTTSADLEVLIFFLFCNEYRQLKALFSLFDGKDKRLSYRLLAGLLDQDVREVERIFEDCSLFRGLNLYEFDTFSSDFITSVELNVSFLIDFFSEPLTDKVLLKHMVDDVSETELQLANYRHMKEETTLLIPYLKSALKKQRQGCNVLMYGAPGTGKTQLAKVLAHELGVKLLAVRSMEVRPEYFYDGRERLEFLTRANELLATGDALFLFDEASEVFARQGLSLTTAEQNKGGLNLLQENNKVPTIWITNNIDYMDNAAIRRFDVVVEFKPFTEKQRSELFQSILRPSVSTELLAKLAKHQGLQVAIVSRAHKVAHELHPASLKNYEKSLLQLINSTLKAQQQSVITALGSDAQKSLKFDVELMNASFNVQNLKRLLTVKQSARICCYGLPGTGKSHFAQYVAEYLRKPLQVVRASDVLNMFVGGSEQNIARIFDQAKAQKAVLVIDEIDSFLQARSGKQHSWEVTLVNEMLVQMENFDGILFGTTNLLDSLDAAALRRFDVKLEFKPFTLEQRSYLLQQLAQELLGPDFDVTTVAFDVIAKSLEGLTAGDAEVLKRQVRFQPLRNFSDLVSRLRAEVALKPSMKSSKSIGFCTSL